MAGVSTKEIKNRIRSMESTKQITKAMEMVAASKLRRAQAQIQNSRPYFEILSDTIRDIVSSNRDFSSPYLQERPVKKLLYIVMAGDRGLAGGYNANVFRMAREYADSEKYPIGKRACDRFGEGYLSSEHFSSADAMALAKKMCADFAAGESRIRTNKKQRLPKKPFFIKFTKELRVC